MQPPAKESPALWDGIPAYLETDRVRLEPIEQKHLDQLWQAAQSPEIWTWIPEPIDSREKLTAMYERLKYLRQMGIAFPFVVFDKLSGECAGSSSYLARDLINRRVEIGYTWLALRWQKTYINTEAKFSLLRCAFEQMGCARVEFKTDKLNKISQAALKRIGAVEEGCLRRHMLVWDGRMRDSVYYSILDSEWDVTRQKLMDKMVSHPS